jgi:4'-phosphopantetheinyl transferase EntD
MEEAAALITDWLTQVAPPGTAAACGAIRPSEAYDDQEAASVAVAVARRRDEFLTGRALARRALAKLCCPPQAILVGEARMPIWPPGFIGSISHCTGMCMAHVGRRDALMGIGVDVERSQAITPDMLDYVCAPAERDRLAATAGAEADIATLAFSAKEAFYKAYFPTARVFLEFTDVELQVDWPTGVFVVCLSSTAAPDIAGRRRLQGRFRLIGPFVVTAVWVAVPARLASLEAD